MIDLAAIESSWLGEFVRAYAWVFPTLETLHFLGLCLLMGALAVMDFRLLGYAKALAPSAVEKFTPWVVFGFAINLVTGIMFFCADPFRYYYNDAFRLKMLLIILTGLNLVWFRFTVHGEMQQAGEGSSTSVQAKIIAALSLIIWVGVIACGRMIPYVE